MATNSTLAIPAAKLAFGSYDWICSQAALVVCPLVGESGFGVEPICYARNVELGSTLIFQPGKNHAARDHLAVAEVSQNFPYRNVLYPHCCSFHGDRNDPTRQVKIHCSWAKGDRDILLPLFLCDITLYLPRQRHHTNKLICILGMNMNALP
jgi:hypothetical protein